MQPLRCESCATSGGNLLEFSEDGDARATRAARSGHDTVNGMDPAERFEALLASGKDSALLRFSLGMHYLKAGEAARAAQHLKRAVEHDKQYSAAWKLLRKALSESGDAAGATRAHRRGVPAARPPRRHAAATG